LCHRANLACKTCERGVDHLNDVVSRVDGDDADQALVGRRISGVEPDHELAPDEPGVATIGVQVLSRPVPLPARARLAPPTSTTRTRDPVLWSGSMRLKDRVVFITGASRGIGRSVALACAREGADVVIAAKTEVADNPRLPGTIHDVAREVEALGRRALPVKLDVRDDAACGAAIAQAIERFGRVDALVNNAGALWWADITETPVKKFDLIMGINVRASFILSHAVLPHMIQRRYGHIVMMSPPVDVTMCGHHGAYAVSKFGMTMIARAIADEYAEHNVTAHALWPATAIESYATLNFGLGGPEMWRKADILSDATVALLAREPSARPGKAWIDEILLREEGVTDFSKYQCVPGVEPPQFPFSAIPKATQAKGAASTDPHSMPKK
jgi:citronellol/citronellal dehydrogenase